MSSLSISSQTTSVYAQYLQSLNYSGALNSASGVNSVHSCGTEATSTAHSTTDSTSTSGSASSSSAASLIQQLETSIQNALSGLDSSQTNNPQDVLASIESAIQTTLKQNGISPNQPGLPPGPPPGSQGTAAGGTPGGLTVIIVEQGNGTAGGTTSNTAISSNDSTSGIFNSSTTQTTGLDSLLSQLGIDPQQFRNDLISALSNSQSGSVNQSQVFQSFSTGQTLNALA